MRVGIGYDIHRITPTIHSGFILVGGIELSCFYRLEAHSDGDVLLHALTDALLGALALGDIGQWFPDSSSENKNRPSKDFVQFAFEKVKNLGFRVNQVDSIIFLEEPKIAPHTDHIRRKVSQLLNLDLSQVSVKAKTMEGFGAIGRSEAIAAQVILTLEEI